MRGEEKKQIKVIVIQRICAFYRLPVFKRLAGLYPFLLLYGRGTKSGADQNARAIRDFESRLLLTVGVNFHFLSRSFYASFFPGLPLDLMAEKPDVVITEGTTNLLNNIVLYFYSRLTRTPVIWWDAGRRPGMRRSLFRRILDPLLFHLLHQAKALIVYGQMGREYYSSLGIPRERIFVAQNSTEHSEAKGEARPVLDKPTAGSEGAKYQGKKVVLFVGALEKRKMLDLLITAFVKVREEFGNAELLIIGDGPERKKLETMVESGNIPGVHFLGRVVEGIAGYFRLCEVLVLPGWASLAVMEAMEFAKPVITVPYGGNEYELIEHNKTGFFIERGNSGQLIATLKMVLSDAGLRQRIGAAASIKVKESAGIENMVSQISSAIEYAAKK